MLNHELFALARQFDSAAAAVTWQNLIEKSKFIRLAQTKSGFFQKIFLSLYKPDLSRHKITY